MDIDSQDLKRAILMGFSYFETQDEIVGFVYANPKTLKRIILDMYDEIDFDFIPNGVGYLRTAYLKFSHVKENEIRFENIDRNIELKIVLI